MHFSADDIASDLALEEVMCQCIHGDREQCDREQAIEDLKTGAVRILIATDVASRGLDIKDITYGLPFFGFSLVSKEKPFVTFCAEVLRPAPPDPNCASNVF